jgi:hypothetical protein
MLNRKRILSMAAMLGIFTVLLFTACNNSDSKSTNADSNNAKMTAPVIKKDTPVAVPDSMTPPPGMKVDSNARSRPKVPGA